MGTQATTNAASRSESLEAPRLAHPAARWLVIVLLAGTSALRAQEQAIQSWALDSNPGWSVTGQWQFGVPTGAGGAQHGLPDPTAGHTGNNVFGVNLQGDYSLSIGGPYTLTAGPINCSGFANVTLRFYRWLNSDYQPYATAKIQVSNNGTTWTDIWSNGTSEIADSSWTQVSYNITPYAANQPAVYIRWSYSVASLAWAYSGWNIDDVELVSRQVVVRPTFRGVWADAFHTGFKSTAEIDDLVARAAAGHYNAIIPEVLAYQDNLGGGHGAYWASDIVPRATDSGGIDSLAYLVQKAHAAGIEVHPWLVTYRVGASWPPSGNPTLAAHPEWMMVPRESLGSLATIGGSFVLDPGSPDAQEYLVGIVKEILSRYEVDGIHWDYIRYETTNAGYPSDAGYTRSGLARFRRIAGYAADGVPAATGEAAWDDFRRREVTELVRRVRAEIAAIRNHPRQPLRHTAALIPWGNAPSDFTSSSAYRTCFQDWKGWLQAGYLDAGCPMLYYREHCSDQAQWYRNWVNAALTWKGPRHMFCGQATYLNSMANSDTQLRYAYDQGADGHVTYSYAATRSVETACDGSDPWSTDWTWYAHVGDSAFAQPLTTPEMPWRRPETATEGTVFGRVTRSETGLPIDNASVRVGSNTTVLTDGNGYYVATMLPATATGTAYPITATTPEGDALIHAAVAVVAGDVRRNDFAIGPLQPPAIAEQPAGVAVCPGEDVVFSIVPAGEGTIRYRWYKDDLPLADGSGFSATATAGLTVIAADASDLGEYRCEVANEAGTVLSAPASLGLKPVTAVTGQPTSAGVQLHGSAEFTVTAQGTGLRYQWKKDGADIPYSTTITGTGATRLLLSDISRGNLGKYQCVVTGDCGSAASDEVLLYLAVCPADYDADGDVDLEDFGHLQACLTGVGVPQDDPACRRFMLDGDSDIDFEDLAIFVGCLSGPGTAPVPNCAK